MEKVMSEPLGNLWIDYAMHNMHYAGVAHNNEDYTRSLMLGNEALTNANLAIAYEQRTANLVALATAVDANGVYFLDPDLVHEAQEKLRERLGMEAGK